MTPEEKTQALTCSPYFHLHLAIISGHDLVVMDRGGTSDPYVKIMQGGKLQHKTSSQKKTLNPAWNEEADIYIEDPFDPICLRVYDKDRVVSDDFMGQAEVHVSSFELERSHDIVLNLEHGDDPYLLRKLKKKRTLGTIIVRFTMLPLSEREYNQMMEEDESKPPDDNVFSNISSTILSSSKAITNISAWGQESNSSDNERRAFVTRDRLIGVVHVVVVQAIHLKAMDNGINSDPYCKVSLGKDKQKTKTVNNTLNPKWKESLDLSWVDNGKEDILHFSLYDHNMAVKDDFLGSIHIDLTELTREVSHNIWRPVEDGLGFLNVIVTISGTDKTEKSQNNFLLGDAVKNQLLDKYRLSNTSKKMKDVGFLIVRVVEAQGLRAADIGGTSDPFAVLELGNARVQTHTEQKTLDPTWEKVITFDIQDIHEVLEVTVYDENKYRKYDFLGKILIPLTKVKHGERKWYKLKEKNLQKMARGNDPQILLEINLFWNPIRASMRTFNPKQEKYESKTESTFKFATFNKNLARVKAGVARLERDKTKKAIESIINWDSKVKSVCALIGFILCVWNFQPWMIPFGLLIPLMKNIIYLSATGGWQALDDGQVAAYGIVDEEPENKAGAFEQMQKIAFKVQEALGSLASFLESIKNIFNFSIPFLSWLGFVALLLLTFVLYFLPVRILVIMWGTNKLTKKLFRPWASSNNEIADFLSRVPDDEEKATYRENIVKESTMKALETNRRNVVKDDEII